MGENLRQGVAHGVGVPRVYNTYQRPAEEIFRRQKQPLVVGPADKTTADAKVTRRSNGEAVQGEGGKGEQLFCCAAEVWSCSHVVTCSTARRGKCSNDDAFTLALRARDLPGYDLTCCGTDVAA